MISLNVQINTWFLVYLIGAFVYLVGALACPSEDQIANAKKIREVESPIFVYFVAGFAVVFAVAIYPLSILLSLFKMIIQFFKD